MQNAVDGQVYTYLQMICSQMITKLENLVTFYDGLLQEDGAELSKSIRELETSPFERARSKMQSQLINISICGAFSSGKSFLTSALINRVEWYEREAGSKDIFDGQKVDRYATFLPTSPEQTSSCPLSIIPLPSSKRSRFEVMFEDTKNWEDKSEPYSSEDEIYRKVLAYATDIEEWRVGRPAEDRPRKVERARLYVGGMNMPAAIQDLPGIGSVGEAYLETVHEALRHADCVLYVASAIKELTDSELSLLRFVEEISEQNRTPVFFLLSQIDREPEWSKVLEKNNQFLRQYFTKDGRPNQRFIGKGFMPVSAAGEAKALGMYKTGKLGGTEKNRAIEKSGMPFIRQLLYEYLTTRSGPIHLRQIIVEMYGLLKSVRAHIANRMQAELVPLHEAETKIQDSRELVKTLKEKKQALEKDLENLGMATLGDSFANSRPTDLLALLRREIEPLIIQSDVTKDSERDKIQQAIKQVRDGWLHNPTTGFMATWALAWENYLNQTTILLNERLSQAAKEASTTIPTIDSEQIASEMEVRGANGNSFERVKTAWQVSVGVTGLGIGGVAAGSIAVGGATIVIAPVGLLLAGIGFVGIGWSMLKNRSDKIKLRKLLIGHLPKYSDRVVKELLIQATENIEIHRDGILNIVDQLVSAQEEKIATLENRLSSGDLAAHQARIDRLRDFENECASIEQIVMKAPNWYNPKQRFVAANPVIAASKQIEVRSSSSPVVNIPHDTPEAVNELVDPNPEPTRVASKLNGEAAESIPESITPPEEKLSSSENVITPPEPETDSTQAVNLQAKPGRDSSHQKKTKRIVEPDPTLAVSQQNDAASESIPTASEPIEKGPESLKAPRKKKNATTVQPANA